MKTKPLHPIDKRKHYGVIQRNCGANEPAWGVYCQQSGAPADILGYFFTQQGAYSYADWRNKHKGEGE